jgi:hypothetical protein
VTGDAGVYALAQLPPPARPAPVAPPGTPTGFAVELLADGTLRLSWRCKHPRRSHGTMYQVYRRTAADEAFAYLGGAGQKTFVDATLPVGVPQVTYQVRAVRSTAVGPWARHIVNFGAAAGGVVGTVAKGSAAAAKLAAGAGGAGVVWGGGGGGGRAPPPPAGLGASQVPQVAVLRDLCGASNGSRSSERSPTSRTGLGVPRPVAPGEIRAAGRTIRPAA